MEQDWTIVTKKVPRSSAPTTTTTTPGPAPAPAPVSAPVTSWPTCDICHHAHNPAACFMNDKNALERFLAGKPDAVKRLWHGRVERFVAKKERESNKAAYLERCARRKKQEASHEAFLKREAKRNREKTKEEKMDSHRRAVVKAIKENGGGAVFER